MGSGRQLLGAGSRERSFVSGVSALRHLKRGKRAATALYISQSSPWSLGFATSTGLVLTGSYIHDATSHLWGPQDLAATPDLRPSTHTCWRWRHPSSMVGGGRDSFHECQAPCTPCPAQRNAQGAGRVSKSSRSLIPHPRLFPLFIYINTCDRSAHGGTATVPKSCPEEKLRTALICGDA